MSKNKGKLGDKSFTTTRSVQCGGGIVKMRGGPG